MNPLHFTVGFQLFVFFNFFFKLSYYIVLNACLSKKIFEKAKRVGKHEIIKCGSEVGDNRN